MAVFIKILTLLGALVLSLYGMRAMSQGILKVAGSRMRASLRGISNRRLRSLWKGTWLTAIMQSSSSMTLMIVSFVNAGLVTLGQSIALIMGANVGTTVTAWLLAFFGYYIHSRAYAIPLIILTLPFAYTSSVKYKPLGETLMGMSLFVLGFTTFIDMVPMASATSVLLPLVAGVASLHYYSVLLFVVLGVCATFVFRSSAATILFAMVLAAQGWVDFATAAGLVIGDNVGTTLTAVMASRKANVSARRAAYSHLMFNLFGMFWTLPLVYPLSYLINWVTTLGTGVATPVSQAFGIALFHTLFNLVSALLLIGFIPHFKLLLARFLPISEGDEDEFHLHFIQGGLLSTAELSIEEARKEAALFGIRCQKMMQLTTQFMRMLPTHANYNHTYSRIEKYEKITDRLELEIVRYLDHIDRGSMSAHMTARMRSLFRIVDELESIGDSCYKLARIIVRRNEHRIRFIPMQQQNLDRMIALTQQAIDQMVVLLQKPELSDSDIQRSYNQEDAINALRGQLREQNIGNIQANHYSYQSGAIYMELVNGFEKLADYIINVLEAHYEQSQDILENE